MNRSPSVLGWMLALILGSSWCAGAAPTTDSPKQQAWLEPAKAISFTQSKMGTGKSLIPLRRGAYYRGALWFDTSELKPAEPIQIHDAVLRLTVQYVERTKGSSETSTVRPVSVELHRLLLPLKIQTGRIDDAPKAGRDYQAKPDFTCPLPENVASGETIDIPLHGSTGEPLADWLSDGFVLTLNAHGPANIIQVNFYGTHPPGGHSSWAPNVKLTFTSSRPMLDLHPAVEPEAGEYVTSQNGDLYYAGKPIHFFGMNMQAGICTSYQAVDNLVYRLRNMNINSVRLWAGHWLYTPESASHGRMVTSKRGDGSPLDRYDYLVYRLQQAGIFIHNTTLGSHGPMTDIRDAQDWPGLDIKLPPEPEGDARGAYVQGMRAMRYFDPSILQAQIAHIKMYLDRVNPYTRQRYAQMPVFASWELNNENHTVASILSGKFKKWPDVFRNKITQRWNQWLVEHYHDRAGLIRAWGKVGKEEDPTKGTVAAAPDYAHDADYPEARGRDFVRFVQDTFIQSTRKMLKAAKSMAPRDVGVNVEPIVANTHAGEPNLNSQYSDSVGDAASVAVYTTPFTTDKSMPHYPWRPYCTRRPYFYDLNFEALVNKPFIVYENSFFRPYKYRAEWNPTLALLGAGLAWDSLYLYSSGQPWAISDPIMSDISFGTKPLPIPTDTSHYGYDRSFHHMGDEVLMSSLAITAQAFINGIHPNTEKTVVTYGPSAYQNPAFRHYGGHGKTAQPVPDRPLEGGEREWYTMPAMYRRLMETSVRRELQLAFDPDQKAPIRISGELANVGKSNDKRSLHPSPDIFWDTQHGRTILDTPTSKIVVGFIKDGYTFHGGVKLGPINRDFAMFGIVSRDGKPIAESKDLLLALCSQSHNTGYAFDPSKIKDSVLGAINGVTNRGTAPVVVKRVGATITLPGFKGALSCYNFQLYRYRQAAIDGQVHIKSDEPLYLARITR